MRFPAGLLLALIPLALGLFAESGVSAAAVATAPAGGEEGCLACHAGIEDMHPGFPLSCVDCHGGDPDATTEAEAHVAPTHERVADERVPAQDSDLAYRRFINPMDLRVAGKVCGDCHGELVEHLMVSLHGTTSAHLSDGFFEVGLSDERESAFAVFTTQAPKGSERALKRLVQPPAFNPRAPQDALSSHFPDLIRKECMQCHLWSPGNAVRGRVGFDGEYRGDGCAACHVPYRTDGLSESFDPTVDRVEPGHPAKHALVKAPPTETCTTCHWGDASIGLHFRGLSQLPPGAPGGPEIEGTTDSLLHRTFFLNDPAVTPPDVHHQSGLACVDCHTLQGVMGDGRMPNKMEDATEITCEACHGSFEARSTLRTERGTPLRHLFERDGSVWMRSKVTGAEHRIKQVVDVLDPAHDDYNDAAVDAMNGAHADVACYTCHAGWNINFLGFHFYRNEALTQLDLLSGQRTPGRVTTQEKVFTTWKSFYAGFDEQGRVAPYLTGFATMGTVDAEDGTRVLDQVLPETRDGLSGMTMIHHQLHSTRPTARSCVECHRAGETWGLGSANFRLGRGLVFVADRRGVEVVAFDRENPQASVPLGRVVQPDIVDLELACDPLQGHARTLFITEGRRGLHAIDVSDPREPRRLDFHSTVEPRGMALFGDHLCLADGIGGLKVFDVSDREELRLRATVPMIDAHEVEVRWPFAYVADGDGGLVVVDVSVPARPEVVSGLDVAIGGIIDVEVLFQYSRPRADEAGLPLDERTPARRLVVALDRTGGALLIDATEPTMLALVEPAAEGGSRSSRARRGEVYRGLVLRSHVDVASPQGGARTVERDLLYALRERPGNQGSVSFLSVTDVSDPTRPERLGEVELGQPTEMLAYGSWYNPPFLKPLALVPGEETVNVVDLSNAREPVALGGLPGFERAYVVASEEFPLDQMLDADGRRLKDVSHPRSRWLLRGEIERVLRVDADALGTRGFYDQESIVTHSAARALFGRADRDLSGVLTGEELDSPLVRALLTADANGDGCLTLGELAAHVPDDEATAAPPPVVRAVGPDARIERDGDIAKWCDLVRPEDFDKNRDGRLDRREARAALFAGLDLDGNGTLDAHEATRIPGVGRALPFRADPGARKPVSRRAFDIADDVWAALDPGGDGAIQLDVRLDARMRAGGEPAPEPEWPTRRLYPGLPLAPRTSAARLLERFDRNGDGKLVKTELRSRPRLRVELDVDRSSVVEPDELERIEELSLRWGVESAPDGFVERWDLDGDGEVEVDEVPPVVWRLFAGSRTGR